MSWLATEKLELGLTFLENSDRSAAALSHSPQMAKEGLLGWTRWASRSRLQPFKRLARTLRTRFEGVIAGMQ